MSSDDEGVDIGGGHRRRLDGSIVNAFGTPVDPSLHGATPGQIHSFDMFGKARDITGLEITRGGGADGSPPRYEGASGGLSNSGVRYGYAPGAGGGGATGAPAPMGPWQAMFGVRVPSAPLSLRVKSYFAKLPLRLVFFAIVFVIWFGLPQDGRFTFRMPSPLNLGLGLLVTVLWFPAEAFIERLVGRRL